MSQLVVFDTNVFVSYLFPSRKITAVKLAVNKLFSGKIIPVFSDDIIKEYRDVLNRTKFSFPAGKVHTLLDLIFKDGRYVVPHPTSVLFTDASDKCFYDAAVAAGAWLVTGNTRHFPQEGFIVTPREYLERVGH